MKNLAAKILSEKLSGLSEESKKKIVKGFSNAVIEEFETLITALKSGIEIHAERTSRETGHTYILDLKVEIPELTDEDESPFKTNNKA